MPTQSTRIPVAAAVLLLSLLPGSAAAEPPTTGETTFVLVDADPMPPPFFRGPIPRSQEIAADARLNDVCAVGSSVWAVGERGVIARSTDRGASWTTQLLPFECSLQSVCFLTNHIGHVAGSRFDPFTRALRSVLLITRDGGVTWQPVDGDSPTGAPLHGAMRGSHLPGLRYVRFFDLEHAVVLTCLADDDRAALQTSDGGRTWTPLKCDTEHSDWTHAAFVRQGSGVIVGSGLASAAVVGDQLVGVARPRQTLQRARAASVSADGHGWIAGDGGFLMYSENGGISWRPPATSLPPQLADIMDFATVAQQGSTVCIAGNPGSVVLRSTDNGVTWSLSPTNQSTPLRRIAFLNPETALAVGELGSILRSEDAGSTWSLIRGVGHRAGVLSLVTNPSDTALPMLAKVSGNDGFRSVTIQPSAERTSHHATTTGRCDRFIAAMTQVGSNAVETDWMFPRTAPEQERVKDQLLQTWNRQTDGRLSALLPLRIARAIRVWRPDVITIERRSEDDRVAEIWQDAIAVARRIADGSDGRDAPLDAVSLPRWTASRVLLRTLNEDRSALTFATDDLLTNVSTTSGLVTDLSRRWLSDSEAASAIAQTASYRAHDDTRSTATPTRMFANLPQQPGSASRRNIDLARADNSDELERVLQQSRVAQAALTGHMDLNANVSLTAEVRQIGSGLPAGLALKQLQHLVELHTRHENLEGLIAVLQEITRRFPGSSDAVDAARQLFTAYSSSEIRLLRTRAGYQPDQQPASGVTTADHNADTHGSSVVHDPEVRQASATSFATSMGLESLGPDRTAVASRWDNQAARALELVREASAESGTTAQILVREAANLQRQRLLGKHNSVLSAATRQNGPFAVFARAELQAVHGAAQPPIPVLNLPESTARPFLDGVLDDECWQDADEVRLTSTTPGTGGTEPDCLVMIAWDREHLYLAGRLQRATPAPPANLQPGERHHDSNHGTNDRIELAIDTDRDYATAFHFSIDESGQTQDRCWISGRWDPDWFVAVDADAEVWRFEAAIPVAELNDEPLAPGRLWTLQLNRVVPGQLQQSLQLEGASDVDTAGFGLVRFIRKRRS